MLLKSITRGLDFIKIKGDLNIDISSLAYDSREMEPGGAFVAISGFAVDGHSFIGAAIDKGARALIVEKDIDIDGDITILRVKDSRRALARLAANFYGEPTKKLSLVGITGTNGKTSTTYFIKSIFDKANKSAGLIGSIGTLIDGRLMQNKNTTPESLNLQKIFADMADSNIENCIMEVSSHSLTLNRVAHCDFNTGIYTNLSPDHLELHKSMEEYFKAKAGLFDLTRDYNIINIDDKYGKRLVGMVKDCKAKLITYGIDERADIYASHIEYFDKFSKYTLNTPRGSIGITVNLPGKIYIYNSLAAIALAYCKGISLEDIKIGIEEVDEIKGRLEIVYEDHDYKVMVDFAHTEDSLKKALTTIRPFVKGRLILVFGVYAAEGDKGRDKRRAMGRVAAKYSDFAVVTSDNPKWQDPNMIIDEIIGAMEEEGADYKAIVDRELAIEYAIKMSSKDDVILITGKGHETSQVIRGREIPFVESEIVTQIIKNEKEKIS